MNNKEIAVESIIREKEIARDILLKMLDQGAVTYEEFTGIETPVELTCAAYRKILTTVREG